MNGLISKVVVLGALSACLAFSPLARAVSPPPDGDYGSGNVAEGGRALNSLTTGVWDTALGASAQFSNSTGNSNTAVGVSALFSNIGGSSNTAVGVYALYNNTGNNNIGIGYLAGINSSGDFNIHIGSRGEIGELSSIRIGTEGQQTSAYMAGIFGVPVTGNAVCVDDEGTLGECTPSSERFKHDIESMDKASEVILALRPVTFHYNSQFHSHNAVEFGLVAEEVAKIDPGLVKYNKKGEIYGIRYDAVNAMLLNEFLKEHQTVEQLKSVIAQQTKQMEAFMASLKAQEG